MSHILTLSVVFVLLALYNVAVETLEELRKQRSRGSKEHHE